MDSEIVAFNTITVYFNFLFFKSQNFVLKRNKFFHFKLCQQDRVKM